MRTRVVLLFMMLFSTGYLFGQGKAEGKPKQHYDCYKGQLTVYTELFLEHVQYADEGRFVFLEHTNKTGAAAEMRGDWTVLRGDATDENATVVELDGPGRILYFLRRKDGSLQQLDTALKAINPIIRNVLNKERVCRVARKLFGEVK